MKFSLPFVIAIGLGLIAFQKRGLPYSGHQSESNSIKVLTQSEVLKYSVFLKAKIASSTEKLEITFPAENLFLPNSTHFRSNAESQLSSLLKSISSAGKKKSVYEVDLSAPNHFANLKFRSSRLHRISEIIQKAGLANESAINLSQTLVEPEDARDVASSSGPSASSDQNISIRIQTAN